MVKLTSLECDDSSCEHWPKEGGSLYCSGEVDAIIDKLTGRISELEDALEIIAGRKQCVDNTLSNVAIAVAVLGA